MVRKRGKGTFVTDPNTRRKGVQYSFTTEISQLGKTPSSTLVDFAVITPSPRIAALMGLEPDVKVYCFTRVRNVDGEPLILETSYYPEYIYPNLTRELLETHSFYSLLYHVGIIPFSATPTRRCCLRRARRSCCTARRVLRRFSTSAAQQRKTAIPTNTQRAICAPTA